MAGWIHMDEKARGRFMETLRKQATGGRSGRELPPDVAKRLPMMDPRTRRTTLAYYGFLGADARARLREVMPGLTAAQAAKELVQDPERGPSHGR